MALLDDASDSGHFGAALEGIHLRQDALREYSDEHIGFLSPIRRVPPEILVEIFLYFLPDGYYRDILDAKLERMLPSHVCKRWRDLSMSTPTHWANIGVEVHWVEGDEISKELECAQAWLARSGICPLTVSVEYYSNKPTHLKQQIELFLPYCGRWRHAKISSNVPADLSSIKHKLPLLEALTLDLPRPLQGAPFADAPKLCQLKVALLYNDERDEATCANLIFPWLQLTHVQLDFVTERECWWIMQKLRNVVSLNIRFSAVRNKPQLSYRTLRLEHLKDLTFHFNGRQTQREFAGFHDHLDVPSMTSYAYYEGDHSTLSLPSFQSLLSRSSRHLVSVYLSLYPMEMENMALVLQCIPDVLHLRFVCPEGSGFISNKLQTLLTASPSLVPRLQHLVLHLGYDFDFNILLAMITSRMGDDGRMRLRSIEISNHRNGDDIVLDEGVRQRLEELGTVSCDNHVLTISLQG